MQLELTWKKQYYMPTAALSDSHALTYLIITKIV